MMTDLLSVQALYETLQELIENNPDVDFSTVGIYLNSQCTANHVIAEVSYEMVKCSGEIHTRKGAKIITVELGV